MLNAVDIDFNIRIQNFLIFEPASQRVKEIDILLKGPEIKEMFRKIEFYLECQDTLPDIILYNKITKIGKMLDLVTNFDNIIMTKFFDRIWRRYSYLSNLGETFLDLKTFLEIFPEYKENHKNLLATRLDDDDDEDGVEEVEEQEIIAPAEIG